MPVCPRRSCSAGSPGEKEGRELGAGRCAVQQQQHFLTLCCGGRGVSGFAPASCSSPPTPTASAQRRQAWRLCKGLLVHGLGRCCGRLRGGRCWCSRCCWRPWRQWRLQHRRRRRRTRHRRPPTVCILRFLACRSMGGNWTGLHALQVPGRRTSAPLQPWHVPPRATPPTAPRRPVSSGAAPVAARLWRGPAWLAAILLCLCPGVPRASDAPPHASCPIAVRTHPSPNLPSLPPRPPAHAPAESLAPLPKQARTAVFCLAR